MPPDSVFCLRFLGGCEIAGPRGAVQPETAKTTAVLVYLALRAGPHSRARLMGLLWPELTEERAAGNLRRALWDLRRRLEAPGEAPLLEVTRSSATFNREARYRLDVEELLAAFAAAKAAGGEDAAVQAIPALQRAAALYRGELLEGFFVDGAAELEEWLLAEREHLKAVAVEAFDRLVHLQRGRGEVREALACARRLLALDPWREESHRAVMELLLECGEPAAALAQYEQCRRTLAEELQTSPSPPTARLAERIRSVHSTPHSGSAVAEPVLPPPHNLPVQVTPFVGREVELERVSTLLADPACSLLSLVGPGGIGKTRLAVQAARLALAGPARALLADGVRFVPQVGGETRGRLIPALGEALGLGAEAAADAPRDLRGSVLDFLRAKRMLLVVDGCEHVLSEAPLLGEILQNAPEVKVLATSRERLDLPGEWVLEVGGLELPCSNDPPTVARSSAVKLFLQAARRAKVGFDPEPDELPRVGEICRRLEGAPLGLELAAGWVRSLSLAELGSEVARDLSLIAGSPGGTARGLRAVFDASWARLTAEEQRVLARLSAFVGGATRAAAEAVAEATVPVLGSLVDKSFLRRETSGRYSMHEVLHHFARERLDGDFELRGRTLAGHARVTAEWAHALEARLWGREQRAVLSELAEELENLRAAWRWAVQHGADDVLVACLEPLVVFHDLRGRFDEGEQLLTEALSATWARQAAPLPDRLLVARAGLRNRLGRYAEAEADLSECRERLADATPELRARALFHLADAAYLQGRYEEARPLLLEVLDSCPATADAPLAAEAWGRLGRVALEEGCHDDARVAFGRSLEAARSVESEAAVLFALNQLGLVAYFSSDLDSAGRWFGEALDRSREASDRGALTQAVVGLAYVAEDRGRFEEAASLYRESLAISRELGDRRGVAYATMLLGESDRRQGRFDEARARYEEALALARPIGSRFLVGLLLGNLAYAAAAAGRLEEARDRVTETLHEYRATGAFTIGLPALISLADVRHAEGRSREALALLGLVSAHPANRQDHRNEVERVLGVILRDVAPDAVAAGLQAGAGLDLDQVVTRLLDPLESTS